MTAAGFPMACFARIVVVLALGSLAASCTRDEARKVDPTRRPNVILWLVDTLRADHLGCYGYDRPTSPAMDKLAREGVLFEEAHVHSNWTQPSVASLLTGCYPPYFEIRRAASVPAQLIMAPEWFRAHGYATAGFTVTVATAAQFGFDQGHELYVELDADMPFQERKRRDSDRFHARWLVEAGLRWIDGEWDWPRSDGSRAPPRGDRPFFLYLHSIDPHLPYQTHDDAPSFTGAYDGEQDGSVAAVKRVNEEGAPLSDADRQHLIDLYDGEIAYNDAQLQRLLDELSTRGLLDDTILIVVSDHGEEFGERTGAISHGHPNLHRELTHVPMILSWKNGLPFGRRVKGLMRGIDLLPTIVDLAGLPPIPSTDGSSVAEAARGARELADYGKARGKVIVDRCQAEFDVVAVRTDAYLFVQDPPRGMSGPVSHLFDVGLDPAESIDVAADHAELVRTISELLRDWQEYRAEKMARYGERVEQALDPATRDRFEQLGYLR